MVEISEWKLRMHEIKEEHSNPSLRNYNERKFSDFAGKTRNNRCYKLLPRKAIERNDVFYYQAAGYQVGVKNSVPATT